MRRIYSTASAIVGNRVKSEWEMKFTLAQKDAETSQRVASMDYQQGK